MQNKFYFTFGTWKQYPYTRGQYLVVIASDKHDAAMKFKKKYPHPYDEMVLNCAAYYSEKEWKSAKDTAETLEDVDKKADGAGDSVEDAGQAAKNADSGFTTWKATLANLASTAITKVISGCTQLAEKMADVTKSAVGHYAEYEQLVGGVETLFKDSSGKLIDYAEKAYKTAGMSSNQYMNTATSFAASLIQGLGGDTAKAVELTNLAITDIKDKVKEVLVDLDCPELAE